MDRKAAIEMAARLQAHNVSMYGPRIGVIRDEAASETKSGIIIPDDAKKKPIRGRVVMIGLAVDPRDKESPCYGLALGDHVCFSKYNGIIFDFEMPDGKGDIDVECFHHSDLYVGMGE